MTILTESVNVWHGLGVSVLPTDSATLANAVDPLNVTCARLTFMIEDPGVEAVGFSDAQWDAYWTKALPRYRITYQTLASRRISVFFSFMHAPGSWTDSTSELRGEGLIAYARMVVSAMVVCTTHEMTAEYVELWNEPAARDGVYMGREGYRVIHMTPDNMSVLVDAVHSISLARSVTQMKIIGPGQAGLLPQNQASEPYITVNANWDAWSLRVMEHEVDERFYNTGTYAARLYVAQRLLQTIRFMDATRPGLPKVVTAFATNATRFSAGVLYGPSAAETDEHALRLIDTVCHIANAGVAIATSWYLTRPHDPKALYRPNNTKRPHRDALALLSHTLPVGGRIYSGSDSDGDETIKLVACKGNTFGVILSRAQLHDAANGTLSLGIHNPAWQTGPYRATCSVQCFPSATSTANLRCSAEVVDSVLHIKMQHVPYRCVVYIKGDVYGSIS